MGVVCTCMTLGVGASERTRTSKAVKYKYGGAELMLDDQISLPRAGVLEHCWL